MTRAKVSAKVLEAHRRHKQILEILEKGSQPREYLEMQRLSRSLRWLEQHGAVTVGTRYPRWVHITDAGRKRLQDMRE